VKLIVALIHDHRITKVEEEITKKFFDQDDVREMFKQLTEDVIRKVQEDA
jgi:hypothetical protein